MATPPKPSAKQQRAEARAKQLEAFRKQEAARKRNRMIGLVLSIVGIIAVIGVVVTVIVVSIQPKEVDPALVGEVQTFDGLSIGHTQGSVDYEQTPPVGGDHNPAWLNCGIYDEEQTDEYAVHSLEHGAVWITYDPATTSDEEVEALREITPDTYAVLSPYPGIGDAFAISAWGAQLRFDDPADPAVEAFIETYWQSAELPEAGAPCTGGVDGPGKVS